MKDSFNIKEKIAVLLKSRWRPYLIGLLAFWLLLMLGYNVAVYHFYNQAIFKTNEAILMEPGVDKQMEFLCNENEEMNLLNRKLAFYKAKLAMTATDSAGLIISVPDSTISLEIKGVKVYESKIEQFYIDPIMRSYGIHAYLSKFGKPSNIAISRGNYEREPIVHIDAPEDTSAAKAIKHSPDTAITRKVDISFELENQTALRISGLTSMPQQNFLVNTWQSLKYRIQMSREVIRFVFNRKNFSYNPHIELVIKNKEALILYRALPLKGQVCIYF
jgi:hypothetical protein